ncbi:MULTISPECIES: Mrp/NBP35 family ATP-binding protein [Planktothricoides]|uniref:Iron-sulfur cluster carrier protein n=2 Tax=Planktothricoides raciborskii TaxID=132608 RepID=A0AAU8J7S7_9CYAN|nr:MULTISPECIES: Mrp/NBP35 family ATP-binding protein [Planktothricoides]KOR35757.1 sodium:proton antiporter [Planktothricoides sp. SR001]MBD2542897.1 Mrp/NBP35 family ATP-binding protein [Planktothricoides raciborskii FACHB-1370]MBD2581773.1 Mrp/NBP35 family ATP-binding protein [Planktothricoides raciborskii FACHB-1261]
MSVQLSEKSVLEVLQPVQDPELQKSLVDLNMIRNVKIIDGQVSFTLVLTTPACPLREFIVEDCQKAVRTLPGVKDVTVEVTAETPQQKSLPDRQGIDGVKNIIAISSGKGGVGKSTVAVNVAVSLAAAGAKVGLLDADIYGPNAPTMLGLSEAQVMVRQGTQGEVLEPAFNHGVKLVSMAFLIDKDQPVIWRGPMLNGVIRQFLYQVQWGDLDYLIVDLPPGTGDAQLTMVQAVPMAGAVIVSTPQTVALLDARKGLKMFQQLNVPVLGIVENMSYFIPPDLPDKQYDIFGSGGGAKTSQELGVSLLGCVPLEIGLREGGDTGLPIVVGSPESASAKALREIAQKIAAKVSVAALT